MICFAGCGERASSFTEEEHIQRITERIKKRDTIWGFSENETHQNFQVYPLYNEDDELNYCLVEFDPRNFLFVRISDVKPSFFYLFFEAPSMYVLSNTYWQDFPWSPYVKDETNSQPDPDKDKSWILDENGERIFYTKSPYFVTGNIDEKKYLIETNSSDKFICAVKKDGKFVNLISGLEVEKSQIYFDEVYSYEKHSTLVLSFSGKNYKGL